MIKISKKTQIQRIGRLENVVSQIYIMNKMIQDELKAIQTKLSIEGIDYSIKDEEE
jgi:hypothetical protein